MTRAILLLSLLLTPLARAADAPKAGGITVDKEKRTISIPAKVAVRKLPNLDQVYPLEVIATWAHDRKPTPGQKAHETVVTFDLNPSELHKALVETFDLKPGAPAVGEGAAASGPELKIHLDIPTESGAPRRTPIERCIVDKKTNKPLPPLKWYFTGSAMTKPSPDKDEEVYGADLTGTLIAIFPVTNQTVIQSNLTMKEAPILKMEVNRRLLPTEGAPLTLIIEVPAAK